MWPLSTPNRQPPSAREPYSACPRRQTVDCLRPPAPMSICGAVLTSASACSHRVRPGGRTTIPDARRDQLGRDAWLCGLSAHPHRRHTVGVSCSTSFAGGAVRGMALTGLGSRDTCRGRLAGRGPQLCGAPLRRQERTAGLSRPRGGCTTWHVAMARIHAPRPAGYRDRSSKLSRTASEKRKKSAKSTSHRAHRLGTRSDSEGHGMVQLGQHAILSQGASCSTDRPGRSHITGLGGCAAAGEDTRV